MCEELKAINRSIKRLTKELNNIKWDTNHINYPYLKLSLDNAETQRDQLEQALSNFRQGT